MAEAPEIVLLAADWPARVLIRAQLIEEGFEVVATNTWRMMRRRLRPGSKPRLAIVDLNGLTHPTDVVADLRVLKKPVRVLILTAIGTIAAEDVRRLGFHTLARPCVIEEIVGVATQLLRLQERSHETVR